jgi:DNA helicase-2/ATP-dependent DNA helicase PcrA
MSALARDLLSDLTPEQRAAVEHTDGPLLILAGAGSGKTRVITRRVAYLLQCGVRAGSILAITFTNKAAGEMKQRVDAIAPGNKVFISTFHSLGARLLRQYSDRLNIDRNFTIYDVDDRNKLVQAALDRVGMDNTKFTPDRLAGAISKAKNALLTPKQYEQQARDFFTQTAAKVYFDYEKRLRAANGMDFDDLLYLPAMALKMNEELRAELDARFKYVLIDEYQDTNQAQYEIARRLSIHHPNLCVVGDPDQSIYKWRGSDIRNILDFERDFPAAKVITLEQNFRSTKTILHAASTVIDHNKQRKKKSLVTGNPTGDPVRVLTYDSGLDEAEGVVLRIKQQVGEGKFRYRDHAIFLRINALSRTLESAFVKHGVPFQIVKGLAFYDRKENKDVLAYLRLLVNPNDTVSFLRAVNEPARGIGKVSLERLVNWANDNELSPAAASAQVARIPEIKGKAAAGLRAFAQLLTDLRAKLDLPPHEIIREVLDKSGYRQMLLDSTDDADYDRLANIEEMVTAAKQFGDEDSSRTLSDFLETITLASDVDGHDEQSDHVSVMTFHAAKGLEFPVVYMLACEQGILPHNRSIESGKEDELEEERRLCFVGMTRAMKLLHLCHARMREFRGQTTYAIPSMFLDELPPEVERVDLSMQKNTARGAIEEWRRGYAATAGGYNPRGVAPVKPAVNPNANPDDYAVGQVVQHDEYGIGQVTEVSGFGALRKVKVRFPGSGEKTFVADKVKLRVVKRGG